MFRARRSAPRCLPEVALGIGAVLLIGAWCSSTGSDDPLSAFCEQADSFEAFQAGLAEALFDPAETSSFFAESLERLDGLVDAAPPTIEEDVAVVLDAFVQLDTAMAAVDHNILEVDERALDNSGSTAASDRVDRFVLANCREEGDPFVSPEDPNAPRPFSDIELDALAGAGEDDVTVAATMAAQLSEELGFSAEDAECVVSEMDVSALSALATGGEVTDADAASFAAALEACDVGLGE